MKPRKHFNYCSKVLGCHLFGRFMCPRSTKASVFGLFGFVLYFCRVVFKRCFWQHSCYWTLAWHFISCTYHTNLMCLWFPKFFGIPMFKVAWFSQMKISWSLHEEVEIFPEWFWVLYLCVFSLIWWTKLAKFYFGMMLRTITRWQSYCMQ